MPAGQNQKKESGALTTNIVKNVISSGLVSKLWIKDASGKPSMSATFVTGAFAVTTFAYIAAIFEKLGPLTPRPFDSGACSSYLIPLVTLYFGRRWTDSKTNNTQNSQDGQV
jgi:hypothetical protein